MGVAIEPVPFGATDKVGEARLWRLEAADGMAAEITDVGACLVALCVPDAGGEPVDVVLGYDDASGYGVNAPNFGAAVGRNANRIGGASFELAGRRVELAANEKGNSLHSGPDMWMHRRWEPVRVERTEQGAVAEFKLESPDGDQGFPGALEMRVTYELTGAGELRVSYAADPDEPTVVNMTQHSYFNLNGHASGTVAGHTLRVLAGEWTEVDDALVPTGRLLPVDGTPLDLREPRVIGEGLAAGFAPIDAAGGYDHNFALTGASGELRLAATLAGDKSGIVMDVLTETPGLQVYSGNFIEGEQGKGGVTYHRHGAVCLETQFFPDAVNHPEFAQPIFGPDRPYRSTTVFSFSKHEVLVD